MSKKSERKENYFVVLVLILLSSVDCISAAVGTPSDPLLCFTAEGLLGDCRPWRFCSSVRDRYPAKKPTICLYRPKDPIVCCPQESFTSMHTTTPSPVNPNSIEPSGHWRPSQPIKPDAGTNQWRPVTDSPATDENLGQTDGRAILWPDQSPLVTVPTAAAIVSTTEAITESANSHQTGQGSDFFLGHPDCGLNTDTFILDFKTIEFRRRKRSSLQKEADNSNYNILDNENHLTKRAARELMFRYFDSLQFNGSSTGKNVMAYTEKPPIEELMPVEYQKNYKTPREKHNNSSGRNGMRYLWQILSGNSSSSATSMREGRRLLEGYQLGAAGGMGFGFGADLGYIVGGVRANLGVWPWLALIGERRRLTTEWFCGGSLLNEKFVITAAHCLGKFKKNRLLVRLGEYDLNYDTDGRHQDLLVDRIFLYPEYRPSMKHHDLALLRLRHKVRLTSLVRPVCLPQPGQDYVGRTVKVAGWGHTQYGGETSAVLQEATFPVVDKDACERQYKSLDQSFDRDFGDGFGEGKLCAHDISGGGQDACQGDSGGPLTYWNRHTGRVHLVGIVSTGVGCGSPAYPGIYTRITTYLDWIRQKAFADPAS